MEQVDARWEKQNVCPAGGSAKDLVVGNSLHDELLAVVKRQEIGKLGKVADAHRLVHLRQLLHQLEQHNLPFARVSDQCAQSVYATREDHAKRHVAALTNFV